MSKNNASNLSGNQGITTNSGNQVSNDCHVALRHSLDFAPRSLEELAFHLSQQEMLQRRNGPFDALKKVGMQAAATLSQVQKGKIMVGCNCNCNVGRRSFSSAGGVTISGPQLEILHARLENSCSLVQEPGTGRHAYVGQCARSTIDGRAITDALQPALVL